MSFPVEDLRRWFRAHKRDLPWRRAPSPYHVWISEVMLQQTQVAVVLDYYEKWMRLFPTVEALASAPLEQVVKAWEGLGYYSRARNLHTAAQQIVTDYRGELPKEHLDSIKGIGPYTRGAILSFAFHERAPAVDGNVMRVLARFFTVGELLEKAQKKLWQVAEEILPETKPWEIAEGLIELGATVCQKKPLCTECPLRTTCLAYRHGKQHELPKKKQRPQATHLFRGVGVIECQGAYLLKQAEKGKVMEGLYEFPYVEGEFSSSHELKEALEEQLGLSLTHESSLPEQQHGFTRYRVHLFPHLFSTKERRESFAWAACEEIHTLPFSSGHKRILNTLVCDETLTY